jgi:hypothetical protein
VPTTIVGDGFPTSMHCRVISSCSFCSHEVCLQSPRTVRSRHFSHCSSEKAGLFSVCTNIPSSWQTPSSQYDDFSSICSTISDLVVCFLLKLYAQHLSDTSNTLQISRLQSMGHGRVRGYSLLSVILYPLPTRLLICIVDCSAPVAYRSGLGSLTKHQVDTPARMI